MRSMTDDAADAAAEGFVGRTTELARLLPLVAARGSAVMWIFGPGGIGKTALAGAVSRAARDAGRPVVAVDLRSVEPSPTAIAGAVAAGLADHATRDTADDTAGRAADGAVASKPAPPLVLLDPFERIAGLEDWVRHQLCRTLPAGTVLVVAGRQPPGPAWRDDPGWSSLLHVVPLRALSDDDAAALLHRAGVPADRHAAAVDLTRGHPLALRLLADVLTGLRAGDGATGDNTSDDTSDVPADLLAAPDLVTGVLARIVDEVPDDEHRRVLDVAALARVTTRGLLRHVFGDDRAGDLFEWLRSRPFVDVAPDGLMPHDLARDALETELRRTDPDAYADAQRVIRNHLLAQRDRPGGATAAVDDMIWLHRGSSLMSGYWDWTTFGAIEAVPPRPDDEDELIAILLTHEDPASATILQHWLRHPAGRFLVVRTPDTGRILGFTGHVVFDGPPDDDDLDVDPVVASVWGHARRNDPPRAGERVSIHRFFDDRHAGQGLSPTFNVVSAQSTRHWMGTPRLAWDYIATIRDLDYWAPMMAYLDYHRAPALDTDVGTTRLYVFCHDWRRVDPATWSELMGERELGAGLDEVPTPAPVLAALGEDEFRDEVRAALKDLARPDRLATNRLSDSRLVRDRAGAAPPGVALAGVLRQALDSLGDDPRTAKARRAVDRTWFHGAVTQEAAAEVLDLPFSTYRRHLAAGTDLLADVLWRWELYGPDPAPA